MDKPRLPIHFETSRDFVRMALSPDITQVPWDVVEECGDQAIAKLKECRASALLVDLTSLNYLGSAQVALLARIWKALAAQQGTMAVQTASPVVKEVLKTAGLHHLWKLVDSQEQGLQKLGINDTGLRVVPTRWTIGPGVTAIASLLLAALTWKGPAEWRFWSGCGVMVMGSLAIFLSRRAILKAEQGQRVLGVLSLLVGLGSVGAGVFFTWPRSESLATLVDPERAAGVRVDDSLGFGEPPESPQGSPSPPGPTPPGSRENPRSLENSPPVEPAAPQPRSQSPSTPAPTRPKQPATNTISNPAAAAAPSPTSGEPVSVDTAPNSPSPDAPSFDQPERPEPPSEPVDSASIPPAVQRKV